MNRSIFALAIAAACAGPMVAGAQGFSVIGGASWGQAPSQNGALPGNLQGHDGFAAGIGLTTGGLFGVGVEGLYAQRGFTSSATGFSQQLSYIDVPVYLKLTIPTGTMLTPYALVGPEVNFEMNCDAGGGPCPSGRDKVTYAGVIGAGLRFGVWTGVAVEGRYAYGLQDLNYGTVSNSANYRPRSFMLLARVGF